MSKTTDNFLRGWCRQVRAALDEGTELGYEAAELILELEDLISPEGDEEPELDDFSTGDGNPGGEVVSAGRSDGAEPRADARGPDVRREQMHLPGIPGVGGHLGNLPVVHDRTTRVPRGTRGGAPQELVIDGQVMTVGSLKTKVKRGSSK